MFKPKNILVPTDFSSEANTALMEAMDIAEEYGAHIYLLHVIKQEILQYAEDYHLSPDEVRLITRRVCDEAMKKLREEIDVLKKDRAADIIPEVRMGDPYEEILKEKDERSIDLVVTSSHERKGWKALFGASLAERLARSTEVETLVVH